MQMPEPNRRKSLYGFEIRDHDQRRNDEGRKTHNIKQVWQHTHEILRLALLGYKNKEIAKLLGISAQTVSNTINSDLGMQKLSEMRKKRDEETINVTKEVSKLFPKALQTYEMILDSGDAALSLKKEVADTLVMDIGGHRAPTKLQGQIAHAHLARIEIEEIKRRGIAAARASGLLAEPVNGDSGPAPAGRHYVTSVDSSPTSVGRPGLSLDTIEAESEIVEEPEEEGETL